MKLKKTEKRTKTSWKNLTGMKTKTKSSTNFQSPNPVHVHIYVHVHTPSQPPSLLLLAQTQNTSPRLHTSNYHAKSSLYTPAAPSQE